MQESFDSVRKDVIKREMQYLIQDFDILPGLYISIRIAALKKQKSYALFIPENFSGVLQSLKVIAFWSKFETANWREATHYLSQSVDYFGLAGWTDILEIKDLKTLGELARKNNTFLLRKI
jgi:hypothetical protein